jgi:hypothetical protein
LLALNAGRVVPAASMAEQIHSGRGRLDYAPVRPHHPRILTVG